MLRALIFLFITNILSANTIVSTIVDTEPKTFVYADFSVTFEPVKIKKYDIGSSNAGIQLSNQQDWKFSSNILTISGGLSNNFDLVETYFANENLKNNTKIGYTDIIDSDFLSPSSTTIVYAEYNSIPVYFETFNWESGGITNFVIHSVSYVQIPEANYLYLVVFCAFIFLTNRFIVQ